MNKVVLGERLVPNIFHLIIEAPEIAASARPGQFVMIIPDEHGERLPLNIADWDKNRGTIEVVFMNLGVSTRKLANFQTGEFLEGVAGPLGQAAEIGQFGHVLLVGGCFGLAGLYPLARQLKERGNRVIFLAEARDQAYLYWESRIKKVVDEFLTLFRTDCFGSGESLAEMILNLKNKKPELSRVIVMGCSYLLFTVSEITRNTGLKTMVNLNPIMVDGTGLCGACRVTVNGKTYFACVNGPEFDGHGVDWEEYFNRRRAFLSQEELALANLEKKVSESQE
jgi:ferredoxin--NADP+ reductase